GLVGLDTPNTLVAEHKGNILRSEDAGCTWTTVGPGATAPLTLVAARGGRAYAFADNGSVLYRIDGTTLTRLSSLATGVLGLAVDPRESGHVRLGDTSGT